MQTRLKLFSVATSLSLGLSLVACSSDSGTKSESSPTDAKPSTAPAASAPASSSLLPISKEKVTVEFMLREPPGAPLSENALVFAELAKRTNVYMHYNKTIGDAYKDKFNITVASNNMPDMFWSEYIDQVKQLGTEGAFLPLDDLLKQHGPNVLKFIKEKGLERDLKAYDGKTYMLPIVRVDMTGDSYGLRQDWLDKLGLKAPDTLDDFYKTLVKFRDEKPGGPNTIPLSVTGIRRFDNIFMAHGTQTTDTEFFVKNDKFVWGPSLPETKEALKFINKLYTEKLLDPEFAVQSTQQFEGKVNSGIVGSTIRSPQQLDKFTRVLTEKDPKAKMVGIAPLTGTDGKKRQEQAALINSVVTLSHNTKKAVEIIKMFNYVFSDEGGILSNYGIEGTTFQNKNGKLSYIKNPGQQSVGLFGDAVFPYKSDPAAWAEYNAGSLYVEASKLQEPYYYKTPPMLNFTVKEMDVLKSKLTGLQDTWKQYALKFILGQEPFEKWDAYIAELNKKGLEEVVKIYNDAYKRYLQ